LPRKRAPSAVNFISRDVYDDLSIRENADSRLLSGSNSGLGVGFIEAIIEISLETR
jgi:hypothetical protein